MGLNWAEHTLEIDAPVETSFDAIVDYESFPDWQNAVESVEVLSRTEEGLGEQVRLFVDAKVRKIDYTLRYRYRPPHTIEWDFVEGNGMRAVDGVYSLEEAGPGRTRATYRLGADPAIPVPGPVARRVHRQLVKRSVEDLKREAERRSAGAGSEVGAGADADEAGGWAPKAAREDAAGSAAAGETGQEPGLGAVTDLPGTLMRGALGAARNPVRASRELVGSALRAGRSVAELGIELGREAADRVDRKLSGRGPGER